MNLDRAESGRSMLGDFMTSRRQPSLVLPALRRQSLTSASRAVLAAALLAMAGPSGPALAADKTVSGPETITTSTSVDNLFVGDNAASGNLTVDGGTFASTTVRVGSGTAAGANWMTVTGAGTIWNNSGSAYFGDTRNGMGVIENGAQWNNTGAVWIGSTQNGGLTVQNGSHVGVAGGVVIGGATGVGILEVLAASSLSAAGIFLQDGYLTVKDGSAVTSGGGINVADGTVSVHGLGSSLTSQDLVLGDALTVSTTPQYLSIKNGGSVTTSNTAIVGAGVGATNSEWQTFIDGGSWNVAGDMTVGLLASGATATSVTGVVTLWNRSTLSVGGDLIVGKNDNGSGTANGRLVLSDSTIWVGPSGGGTVYLGGSSGSNGALYIGGGPAFPMGFAPTAAPGELMAAMVEVGDHGTGALAFNHTSDNYTFAPVISGNGSVSSVAGTTILTADSSGFSGQAFVNTSTLIVNGKLGGDMFVRDGGTLAGNGTVGNVFMGLINSPGTGGFISPGNSVGTLTVNGNLDMRAGSGATYVAEVQGATADLLKVTGAASLAGTLRLVPLGGPYTFNSPYTLLSAAGGRSGTFGTVDTTGSFGAGVTTNVTYTANNVLLTLAPAALVTDPSAGPSSSGSTAPTLGANTSSNVFAVASALDHAMAGGADLSSLFNVYNQPAAALPGAINQLSGEVHASVQALAATASDQFMRAMLDPTAIGRQAGPGTAAFTGTIRKGADSPARPSLLDPPTYSVWGAAFGSTGRTDGEARTGSARRDLDDAHLAVGADLRIAPGTVAGFAVSDGSGRASLSGGLGRAEADVFQAGLYGTTRIGALNLGAALAYGRLENEVKRAVPVLGSSLSSSYGANAWSGRLQASLPIYEMNGFSASPFAAIQSVHVSTPHVIEGNWAGAAGGALAVRGRSDRTTRTELGAQLDLAGAVGAVPVTGYVRAAWGYYAERDAGVGASFVGIAGSGFVAEGAKAPRNSALLTAGLDLRLTPAMTLGARLDGELAGSASRIGGSAKLKVSF